MLTLAIESSGPRGSLALLDETHCLAERELALGSHHGQSLVPEIARLVDELGYAVRDCQLIAVNVGPGSFTGLRVGVTCAKTLAYATGCRLAAVEAHEAIASNTPSGVDRLQVITPAQRGDLFVSRFVAHDAAWAPEGALTSIPADTWIGSLSAHDVISGPGLEALATRLAGICRILDQSCWIPQAAIIGRLGYEQGKQENWADPWTLEPLYVRRSSAEEKWDLRKRG